MSEIQENTLDIEQQKTCLDTTILTNACNIRIKIVIYADNTMSSTERQTTSSSK